MGFKGEQESNRRLESEDEKEENGCRIPFYEAWETSGFSQCQIVGVSLEAVRLWYEAVHRYRVHGDEGPIDNLGDLPVKVRNRLDWINHDGRKTETLLCLAGRIRTNPEALN